MVHCSCLPTRERETKRTFSNILSQAKVLRKDGGYTLVMLVEGISTSSRLQEDLDNLEVAVPAAKTARIPQKSNQNVIDVSVLK